MENSKFLTLSYLIDCNYKPIQLAHEIEINGVYRKTGFDNIRFHEEKSYYSKKAIKILEDFQKERDERAKEFGQSFYDSLDCAQISDHSHPLDDFGWHEDHRPKFDGKKIRSKARRDSEQFENFRQETLLNIIGALLTIIVKPDYARGQSQSALISKLLAKFSDLPGLSKSNLERVFAAALRSFTSYQKIHPN
jgi:hypothetical protein